MKRLHITNGLLIDPLHNLEEHSDLTIVGDSIARRAPADINLGGQVIDASGLWVFPGLIDLAVHLRQPGHTYKATIASETQAAAAGGITTVVCAPDTSPPLETPADLALVRRLAIDAGYSRVLSLAALTTHLEGRQLSEMAALKAEPDCVGVSNARKPIASTLILRRALEYAASQNLTVFLHPLDHSLCNDGNAHEGAVASRLGLAPFPEAAETAALAMQLELVRQTGARVHFCRLSCARSVKLIERAKREKLDITADVAAHQLFLTETNVLDFNTYCKTDPPLRTQRDREALREGLASGVIDAICSDHQPHDLDAKLTPYDEAENGISGLETLLPLTMRLVEENVLTRHQALRCISSNPAKILGMSGNGHLGIGSKADLCLYDPQAHWEADEESWVSAGKNSPFFGQDFNGKVLHTVMDGNHIYHALS